LRPLREEYADELTDTAVCTARDAAWQNACESTIKPSERVLELARSAAEYKITCGEIYGAGVCKHDLGIEVINRHMVALDLLRSHSKALSGSVDVPIIYIQVPAASSSSTCVPFSFLGMASYHSAKDPISCNFLRLSSTSPSVDDVVSLDRTVWMDVDLAGKMAADTTTEWSVQRFRYKPTIGVRGNLCFKLLELVDIPLISTTRMKTNSVSRALATNDEVERKRQRATGKSGRRTSVKKKKAPGGSSSSRSTSISSSSSSSSSTESSSYMDPELKASWGDALHGFEESKRLGAERCPKTGKVHDHLGNWIGTISYTANENRPVWVVATLCKCHSCKRRTSSNRKPFETGLIKWLLAAKSYGVGSDGKQTHYDAYLEYAFKA
jgi:hypothetical protein